MGAPYVLEMFKLKRDGRWIISGDGPPAVCSLGSPQTDGSDIFESVFSFTLYVSLVAIIIIPRHCEVAS